MHSHLYTQDSIRQSGAFSSKKEERRYWITLSILVILGIFFAIGLLLYNNPVPVDSPSFFSVLQRRITSIVSMAIAAICHSMATITFQSLTSNRIITPSLLGFEALYATINTSIVFFFGANVLLNMNNTAMFVVQILLMVGMCLLLYGTLLKDSYQDMHLVLLIGIILGTGLRSISSFMRRILTPSDFDILQAKLMGSVNNAERSYFIVAVPVVLLCTWLLFKSSKALNVMGLGQGVPTVLGLSHKKEMLVNLVIISILMAVSTALVGSLTFYGFLVVTFTYRLVPSFDHKYLYPMSLAFAFLLITASYFLMYHVLNIQGYVSIMMEIIGGTTFLLLLLKRSES